LLSSQKTRPSEDELQRLEQMIQQARADEQTDGGMKA